MVIGEHKDKKWWIMFVVAVLGVVATLLSSLFKGKPPPESSPSNALATAPMTTISNITQYFIMCQFGGPPKIGSVQAYTSTGGEVSYSAPSYTGVADYSDYSSYTPTEPKSPGSSPDSGSSYDYSPTDYNKPTTQKATVPTSDNVAEFADTYSYEPCSYRVTRDSGTGDVSCFEVSHPSLLPTDVISFAGVPMRKINGKNSYSLNGKSPPEPKPCGEFKTSNLTTMVFVRDVKTRSEWLVHTTNGEGEKPGGLDAESLASIRNARFYRLVLDPKSGHRHYELLPSVGPK
jgi:hypothetical protein